jgi:hypothetical protein
MVVAISIQMWIGRVWALSVCARSGEIPVFPRAPRFLCCELDSTMAKVKLHITKYTTLSNGYLGSHNDEERSEMRYVMRIAEFSESSNL